MIYAEETARRGFPFLAKRMKPDEISIVAKLLFLHGGSLSEGVKSRDRGENRITPAQHDIGGIAVRHMNGLIRSPRNLRE